MGRYFSVVCMILLLAGCGAGSNLNIVSPSASDEEVKQRAAIVMSEQSTSQKKERQEPAQVVQSGTPEKTQPAETKSKEMRPAGEPPAKCGCTNEALVNLLEKKGIITRKELREEMKRLGQEAP